jgi:hypothetical protein
MHEGDYDELASIGVLDKLLLVIRVLRVELAVLSSKLLMASKILVLLLDESVSYRHANKQSQ